MEQRGASLDSDNQLLKARLSETKSWRRKSDNEDPIVMEEVKLNGDLLVTDEQSEKELKAKIIELQFQLDGRGDLLAARDAEIAGVKMKLESQIESTKAYVEISESVGRKENEQKARIKYLENQLIADEGTKEARDVEASELKIQEDPQIEFLKHQFHEREDEIRTLKSALQQQEEKYQGEIKDLRSQVCQKEIFLKESEEAMADIREKGKSELNIHDSEKHTKKQLEAKISDLEKHLEKKQGTLTERNVEVSEINKKTEFQVKTLQSQLHGMEESLQAKEIAMQQQGERFQIEYEDIQSQLSRKERLLKENEEFTADVRKQAKSQNKLLDSEKKIENKLKEKIADIERRLAAKEGISETRDSELSEFKKKAVSQIQSLEAQLRERDGTLMTRESALQQLEARYRGEINDLMEQLREKEDLLIIRDEAMAGVGNQSNFQETLLNVVKHTGQELKAIKSLIRGLH